MKELAQFIGKGMQLGARPPRGNSRRGADSGPIFNLYMGKKTPKRKDYITDTLIVPVET